MIKTSDYHDLEVWQKSIDLTTEVYRLVKLLPHEEQFALCDQMRRAVVSVLQILPKAVVVALIRNSFAF